MDEYEKIPLRERLVHAWNIFRNKDPSYYLGNGMSYLGSTMPSKTHLSIGAEKSIVTAVYTRIAVDVASLSFKHVITDEDDRFKDVVHSKLNRCLTVEANKDQTYRAFLEDVALSLVDEGYIAIVPTSTDEDPRVNDAFDVIAMRVARIKEWYPDHVRIEIYNDITGQKDEYTLPKKSCCIIENPFYPIMNEPNSVAQRLMRKIALLDSIDNRNGSDRLDLLIQVPYTIKSDMQRKLAAKRLEDMELMLRKSPLGIGYIDGSEKVIQLNRSVENQLVAQVTELTSTLLSQLGLTMEILNGTADANAMNNYYTRTIEPIASSISDEMTRKFLTPTAITQHKSIKFYRDPFKLMPISDVAEIADKFTRNAIMTSNEIRQKIGMRPSKDPNADVLSNKNISDSPDVQKYDVNGNPMNNDVGGDYQNGY
ncbi:MAG: phage portal protein [Pseudobutyrivibrio sp.]|nr:phage portal protein [Pseudobutyrivibrio sp.]